MKTVRGVIVKFKDGTYSIKTTRKCFWCANKYYDTEQEARSKNKGLNFYPKVINQLDYFNMNLFNETVNRILKTEKW